ncbi:formyltetrahydrofolate-dependent phosphoribosylglycinamide formyltransferase [Thermosyntropha lipolytica DSM 11003]|uniref:Phosphoribosylglycinamide formyltransferase n=1 Tax=Thermosyntropha lipolytica DSM 11003 TaxID=1123382 RepID=A0A1M5JBB1_9FIRM|nr:phosphoribosylglycinamide formyltransferase [Thermosyntropha lipolytica]SHG37303.1 formyltetrahydrofolate-dependent phosphoribosylglycinamide formyltransferase [Thermosyntropha lipolytica DSM 11003]
MIRIKEPGRLKLGILASGRGSNFLAIYEAVKEGRLDAEIKVLLSDKKEAPALLKARERGIDAFFVDPLSYPCREKFEEEMTRILRAYGVDVVVLAGYMRLLGRDFLKEFPLRVFNIHPALLPSFTGLDAQKQALEYGVRYSGCTVHIVDEGMDTGPIVLQEVVPVYQEDTVETLSLRILEKEHQIYWQALQLLAEGRLYLEGRRVIIR